MGLQDGEAIVRLICLFVFPAEVLGISEGYIASSSPPAIGVLSSDPGPWSFPPASPLSRTFSWLAGTAGLLRGMVTQWHPLEQVSAAISPPFTFVSPVGTAPPSLSGGPSTAALGEYPPH